MTDPLRLSNSSVNLSVTARLAEEAIARQREERYALGPVLLALRALNSANQEGRGRTLARRYAAELSAPEQTGEALFDLARTIPARHYAPEEVIIKEGEVSADFYVIERGLVRVMRKGLGAVAHLGPGQTFGEVAAITGAPRTATVIAEQPTQVLLIPRKTLGRARLQAEAVDAILTRLFRDRLLHQLLPLDCSLFAIDIERRRSLFRRFVPRVTPPMQQVVTAGETSPGLFVILSGKGVRRKAGRPELQLAPGDVITEASIFSYVPSEETVEAVTPLTTLLLRREVFQAIMEVFPDELARARQSLVQPPPLPIPGMTPVPGMPVRGLPPPLPGLTPEESRAERPLLPWTQMCCPGCGREQVRARFCAHCGVNVQEARSLTLQEVPAVSSELLERTFRQS